MQRVIKCCVWLILLSVQMAHADEQAITPDKSHINYLRQYMATNHFFDRLTRNVSGNTSNKSIERQIKADRVEAQRQFSWVLKEYPLYSSIPYAAFYAGALALGGTAYNYRQSIQAYYASSSEIAKFLMLVGSGYSFVLSLLPAAPLSILAYYTAFPPDVAEENLILTYGSKKNFLDKSTQHYIEDELFYSFWRSPSSDGLNRLQKILDKALRLPFYSKELTYDELAIDHALKNYPEHLRKRLKRFARAELIYQQTDASIIDSHYPVYFQGVPGSGKTHAAKKLAERMGTNLAVVSLDGATIDDITGTSFESADARAGRIVDAIIARTNSSQDINHSNQILLIDEFDRLFLSDNERAKEILPFFQKLLDPADRSFYSPYLKTRIRLPDTIILAGNYDIHELSQNNPVLEGIASRLEKIEFPGFDADAKKAIATETLIPNKEKRYQSAGKSFESFTLPEQGYDMIYEFIEHDKDVGLRSLEKRVSEVFEYFANGVGM